jgi:hypothetical protein
MGPLEPRRELYGGGERGADRCMLVPTRHCLTHRRPPVSQCVPTADPFRIRILDRDPFRSV